MASRHYSQDKRDIRVISRHLLKTYKVTKVSELPDLESYSVKAPGGLHSFCAWGLNRERASDLVRTLLKRYEYIVVYQTYFPRLAGLAMVTHPDGGVSTAFIEYLVTSDGERIRELNWGKVSRFERLYYVKVGSRLFPLTHVDLKSHAVSDVISLIRELEGGIQFEFVKTLEGRLIVYDFYEPHLEGIVNVQ